VAGVEEKLPPKPPPPNWLVGLAPARAPKLAVGAAPNPDEPKALPNEVDEICANNPPALIREGEPPVCPKLPPNPFDRAVVKDERAGPPPNWLEPAPNPAANAPDVGNDVAPKETCP